MTTSYRSHCEPGRPGQSCALGPRARFRLKAALMSAKWVKAWGEVSQSLAARTGFLGIERVKVRTVELCGSVINDGVIKS